MERRATIRNCMLVHITQQVHTQKNKKVRYRLIPLYLFITSFRHRYNGCDYFDIFFFQFLSLLRCLLFLLRSSPSSISSLFIFVISNSFFFAFVVFYFFFFLVVGFYFFFSFSSSSISPSPSRLLFLLHLVSSSSPYSSYHSYSYSLSFSSLLPPPPPVQNICLA